MDKNPKEIKEEEFHKSSLLPFGIGIGIFLGMIIGLILDNILVGISIGLALGVAMGLGAKVKSNPSKK